MTSHNEKFWSKGMILFFAFFGAVFIATFFDNRLEKEDAKFKHQRNCQEKTFAIKDTNVTASIIIDSMQIDIKILRNRDPEKRNFICGLRQSQIYLKTEGGEKAKISKSYYLENRGLDIVLKYQFSEKENFDFFRQNINEAYFGLSIAD